MQQRSEETKKKILSTALALFSKQGYDGTGINEICSTAVVSKGSFYHHFHSKHDLFIYLLESWLSALDGQLSINLQYAESVPIGLTKIAQPLGHIFTDAEGSLPMFMEFWLQSSRDPDLWKSFFQKLIEKGFREGSIKSIDSHAASQVLVALSLGLLLSSMVDPKGGDWGDITQTAMNYLMDGIKKEN
jgi:AcrR family transcriptional regulator